MSKKKNFIDFDSLLRGAHLPSSKSTLSEALEGTITEFTPKNSLDKNDNTCQNYHDIEDTCANLSPQVASNLQDTVSIKKQKQSTKDISQSAETITQEASQHTAKSQSKHTENAHAQKPLSKKEKTVPHYHGHRERLRNRVLSQGHNAQSYEILELLLGYVHGRRDTKPMAKDLLHKFGSLWGVLNAHPAELSEVDNLGPSTKVFFTLLREVIARYFVEPIKAKKSVSISEIVIMARCMMDGLPHEEIWVALLDNNNRLLAFSQVESGMHESVSCSARRLTEIAIDKKASALILIHNHPGGNASPSASDIETTKHLQYILKQMNIRLLEHLILADGNVISFMNNHILSQEKNLSFFSEDTGDTFL